MLLSICHTKTKSVLIILLFLFVVIMFIIMQCSLFTHVITTIFYYFLFSGSYTFHHIYLVFDRKQTYMGGNFLLVNVSDPVLSLYKYLSIYSLLVSLPVFTCHYFQGMFSFSFCDCPCPRKEAIYVWNSILVLEDKREENNWSGKFMRGSGNSKHFGNVSTWYETHKSRQQLDK